MTRFWRHLPWLILVTASAYAGPTQIESYYSCRSCHGDDGLGSPAINAPRIAGQLEGYIARQLANYRDGVRGAHAGDTYGRQMALMANGLDSEKITELASYISVLSSWESKGEPVKSADSALYQPCAACHGTKGEGNAALLSPRIGGMDARYIATQLRHFRDGVRGTSPSDSPGQTMRAALPASLDDTGIEKLARYIAGM